jgi:Rrf2 family protein
MNFSKTTQYALRVMSFMAKDEQSLYVANELYEQLQIPQHYLRSLLKDLSKSGLLVSTKGKGGGFRLSRSIDLISLSDIVKVTEHTEILSACIFGFENCCSEDKCVMHDIWTASKLNINNVLNTMSLRQVVEKGIE